MKKIILECQGLPCPQPVLQAKKCIENNEPKEFTVIVDNEAAKENVTRFLASKNYKVQAVQSGQEWQLVASTTKDLQSEKNINIAPESQQTEHQENKTLIFISSDTMGKGDDKLGQGLMKNFLATLPEMGSELWRIIMVNGGIKLAVEGSPMLASLQQLEKSGVSILVCGTCLDFFGLLEKKQVGQTTNMLDVVSSLQLADKVITI